ncbi:MAG: hypothetical protein ACOCXG_03450 [Nanoarchaeota archaeon]
MSQEAIKKEAKQIMDNFMKSMKGIEVEDDFLIERKNSFRKEEKEEKVDEEFKQRFLKNAPKTKGDAILAEKGSWVNK